MHQSHKIFRETIKSIKQQILTETGQTHPFELRPGRKRKKMLAANASLHKPAVYASATLNQNQL